MSDGGAAFGDWWRAQEDRERQATEIYEALKQTGRLRRLRPEPLTYWCTASPRCSLLDVITLPDGAGVIVGVPRYKTSPGVTAATSSESGRRNNTEDGQRRWRRHASFIENVSNPPLSCDHLHSVALPDDALRADLAAGHAEVIVRRDGTRYAVR